jgi:spectinomycin phosphotransferase
MFDRPPLTDDAIANIVRGAYGRGVARISFLGLGNDAAASTFRADLDGGDRLFLKVRRRLDPSRLDACAYLFESGIEAVVAPMRTTSGELRVPIDGLFLVAYPYLEARQAVEVGLTDAQWIEYGSVVGRVHGTRFPAELEAALPHEAFVPGTLTRFEAVAADLDAADPAPSDDASRTGLVELWRKERTRMRAIADRTRALATRLATRLAADGSAAFVPCHGDVHTHNVLVDEGGSLRVVDWDEIVMAPRERDLMFLLGSPIGLPRGEREIDLFARGYGPLTVDSERLAYYHAEWAIQDFVGYADEAVAEGASPESRARALAILRSLFDPDGEADVALR